MFRGKMTKAAVSLALSFVFVFSSVPAFGAHAMQGGAMPGLTELEQPPAEYTRVTPTRLTPRYMEYLAAHKDAGAGFTGELITITADSFADLYDWSTADNDRVFVEPVRGWCSETNSYVTRNSVITQELGFVTFRINVEQAGLFAIQADYLPIVEHVPQGGDTANPIRGTGGPIERSVFINGVIPFNEAWAMEMTRIYVDLTVDHQGNPSPVSGNIFRPEQIERPRWNTETLSDQFGYYGEALYFFFEAGEHQLTFRSIREAAAISEIRLISRSFTPINYAEYIQKWEATGARDVTGGVLGSTVVSRINDNGVVTEEVNMPGVIYIGAEEPYEKGDPTLFAFNDTLSTRTLPYNPRVRLMNAIGGTNWQFPNQWISWEFEVPQTGFYNISFRALQTFQRDVNSNRSLFINGELPFAEAAAIEFPYSTRWYTMTASDAEGTPFRFHLEEGRNVITLKITAGELTDVLSQAAYVLDNLQRINLELISFITSNPDRDRDYNLGRRMPETFLVQYSHLPHNFRYNNNILRDIREELIERNGGRNDALTAQLQRLITSIERLYERPDDVPRFYRVFREELTGFGTWIQTMREHALVLDRIIVSEPGVDVSVREDNLWDRFVAMLIGFINSFVTDFSMLTPGIEGDYITVWIGGITGGRDQAMALNQIIVRDFTNHTNIPVNLQLVATGVVLVATLSGRGPDVTLSVAQAEPVDFALRNAVVDLTIFNNFPGVPEGDFDRVAERFFPGTLTPFELYREHMARTPGRPGVYALPETATFPMLFYRIDVLQDLGIDPATELRTWQSIVELYPELLAQNMEFGMPSNFDTFMMFLYQMGGELYRTGSAGRNSFVAANLDSALALEAFRFFTNFYLELAMPIDFDFANRFRSGEMPIAIAGYNQFNMLSIFAPELRGRWTMVPVPGFERFCDDAGEVIVDSVVPVNVGGAIMMAQTELPRESWEFLKWWTDADAQFNFGRTLEAVMGAAARHNTANIEAFERLPWAAEIRQALEIQAGLLDEVPEHLLVNGRAPLFGLRGIPEVPGGYFTTRHFEFARNDVLNESVHERLDARQRLLRTVIYINNEITRKREEFGLSLL